MTETLALLAIAALAVAGIIALGRRVFADERPPPRRSRDPRCTCMVIGDQADADWVEPIVIADSFCPVHSDGSR
ncbi:hypothetical protein GCM10009555_017890 [Acrocarpospora macrocephala]|uniref:Uncharacterized protein n=1 Tax=Acrocarpospora macrocephala TaxID=150177 RepID=A0A5M3WGT4_9ACTN|nr:hypothetical protein [Acrocarpospora macrocephala]GES07449.1 hypothetical protein Amac_010440 [Acrocarpospora macrocephala]